MFLSSYTLYELCCGFMCIPHVWIAFLCFRGSIGNASVSQVLQPHKGQSKPFLFSAYSTETETEYCLLLTTIYIMSRESWKFLLVPACCDSMCVWLYMWFEVSSAASFAAESMLSLVQFQALLVEFSMKLLLQSWK